MANGISILVYFCFQYSYHITLYIRLLESSKHICCPIRNILLQNLKISFLWIEILVTPTQNLKKDTCQLTGALLHNFIPHESAVFPPLHLLPNSTYYLSHLRLILSYFNAKLMNKYLGPCDTGHKTGHLTCLEPLSEQIDQKQSLNISAHA